MSKNYDLFFILWDIWSFLWTFKRMRYFEICFNFLNIITVLFILANFVTTSVSSRYIIHPIFYLFYLRISFLKIFFWIHFGNLKLDSKRFSKFWSQSKFSMKIVLIYLFFVVWYRWSDCYGSVHHVKDFHKHNFLGLWVEILKFNVRCYSTLLDVRKRFQTI